jgi:hypothetical protein
VAVAKLRLITLAPAFTASKTPSATASGLLCPSALKALMTIRVDIGARPQTPKAPRLAIIEPIIVPCPLSSSVPEVPINMSKLSTIFGPPFSRPVESKPVSTTAIFSP